ncbi:hypothetical protein W823_17080 [Williamsia sp. D3]|nr:hypothetical protein W823_17080 [Williamsia sp. D3]
MATAPTVHLRYRVTVGISGGEVEFRVQPRQEAIGHGVLEYLGLVVHFVPSVAEFADEECLQQTMPPDHQHRGRSAGLGERDRSVALVHHEILIGELADRLGRGGR